MKNNDNIQLTHLNNVSFKNILEAKRDSRRVLSSIIQSLINLSIYVGGVCLFLYFLLRLFEQTQEIHITNNFTVNQSLLAVSIACGVILITHAMNKIRFITMMTFRQNEKRVQKIDVGHLIVLEENSRKLFLETEIMIIGKEKISSVYVPINAVSLTKTRKKDISRIHLWCKADDLQLSIEYDFSLKRYTKESVTKLIDILVELAEGENA